MEIDITLESCPFCGRNVAVTKSGMFYYIDHGDPFLRDCWVNVQGFGHESESELRRLWNMRGERYR